MIALDTNAQSLLHHWSDSSRINNVLVKIAPEPNQLQFQFIDAVDMRLVNTFLHGRLYLTVNQVELCAVRRPKIHEKFVLSLRSSSTVSRAGSGALSCCVVK